jgi:AcrR family transcriptional regulator
MGRKLGLTLDDVVAQAAEIADRDGLDQLSLASVASGLGVRSPSLYNHVDGLPGLRRQLAMCAGHLMAGALADAVGEPSGTVGEVPPADALRAVADAYRRFALAHPGLYAATLPAPTPEQDPEVADALAEPVRVVASVLDSMGIEFSDVIPLIRALRASIHGFVDIELGGGFGLPDDIDESFATTIDLVVSAIEARSSVGLG